MLRSLVSIGLRVIRVTADDVNSGGHGYQLWHNDLYTVANLWRKPWVAYAAQREPGLQAGPQVHGWIV